MMEERRRRDPCLLSDLLAAEAGRVMAETLAGRIGDPSLSPDDPIWTTAFRAGWRVVWGHGR
jgi:hypothetical protein